MKRKLSLLVFAFCIFGMLKGQTVFYPSSQAYTSDKDEWYIDAVALNNKELVLLGANITEGQKLQELVLQKINLAGVVSLERKLPLSADSVYRFCNLFYRNGQLEVFGYAGKLRADINSRQYHNVLNRYVFDVALNFLYKETIPLPITIDYTIVQARLKINKEGNVYGGMQLYMEPSQVPLNPYGNFYFVLDSSHNLKHYLIDSIQYEINDLLGAEIQQISYSNYFNIKGVNYRDAFKSYFFTEKFDLSFGRIPQFLLLPDLLKYSLAGPYGNLLNSEDTSTFFMAGTGAKFDPAQPFYHTFFLSQFKVDSMLIPGTKINVLRTRKVLYFAQRMLSNSMSNTQVPAYFQCIDRNTQGEYVFGGMVNHRMDERTMANDLVADTLCFAVVNADLTLKLQTNFFNNEQITLHKVMYMPDGNMMAIGFTRDYVKNPSNITRNYFALKLNNNGDPVTGLAGYNIPGEKVSIYPNPALTSVNITCEFIPKEYLLLNSLGQVIKKDKPSQNAFSIDLSMLESGSYFLQIFNQEGAFTVSKLVH